MKKFLSAFLAVLMVLSMVATSMVTVFAADGAEEVHSVLVSNGEDINADQSKNGATQAGWRNHKTPISLMNVGGQLPGMTVAAGSAVTDLRFHYLASKTVDTTAFTHVEFDLYVNDVEAIAGIEHFALELTSIGKEDDGNEFQFLWDDLSALKAGWNHVKFPFSSFTTTGTYDATKWNFVRFFAAAGSNYAKELVIAIDNFGFSDGTEAPAEAVAHEIRPNPGNTVFGWEVIPEKWNVCFDTKTPDGSNAYLLRTYAANETLAANMFNMFWWDEAGVKSFNAAEADTFAMDMWLSDTAAIANTTVRFEIGSGSMNGLGAGTYVHYDVKLGDLVEGGLKANAWNTFKISLNAMTKNTGDVDWTKIDWFRLWNIENATTGADGLKVGIDSVRFLKGDEKVVVMSECQPEKNGWDAPLTKIKDAIVFGKTATDKYAICDLHNWYCTPVGVNISGMKYLEYDLYISDVETLKNVKLYTEINSSGDWDKNELGYDRLISEYNLKDGWNHIKVELSAMVDTAGNGACDLTDIKWFRVFTVDEIDGIGEITTATANVRYTDDTNPPCENCQVVHAINLPKPGTTVAGWGWGANFALNDTVSISTSYAANTDVHFCGIYIEHTATPVDATAADAFEFDFYVSDTTGIENATLEIEIASIGCDHGEMSKVGKIGDLIEGGLKAGWNTVVMPFDKLNSVGEPMDWAGVKYFRIYNQPDEAGGLFTTGENGLTIALDNLRFTKEGKKVATFADINPDMMGWGDGTPLFAMGDGIVMGKTVTGKFDVCDVYYTYTAPEAFDVTGMKYLEFDFYLSDDKALKPVNWTIEITSAGKEDHNELGITKSFNGFVKGWNHVQVALSDLTDTAGNGACDTTAINFFRMFTIDVVDVEELTFALTNVRFTDGEAPAPEVPEAPEAPETPEEPEQPEEPEVPTINIPLDGPWSECWAEEIEGIMTQTRIYYMNPGPHGPGGFMFRYNNGGKVEAVDISGMKYLEFDVFVSDPAVMAEVEFSFELTSSGDSDKEESAKKFKGKDTGWVQGWNHVKWELTEFDVKNGEFDPTRWNYIRWYNDTALNAGDWFQVGIKDIKFTADPVVAEPEVPTINVPLDGPWTECWAEELEGILTQTRVYYMNPGPHGPGGFMFSYGEGGKAEAVDISGMKYLEFDVYVSDPAIIAEVEFSFELTSGGTSDQQEAARKFKGKETGWVQGWNHVKWDLREFSAKTGGDFDATAWNFIRWYNDTALNAGDWFQVAIKDVKFTGEIATDNDNEAEDKYTFTVDNGDSEKKYLDPDYTANWQKENTLRFADQSQYFIYKFDLTAFRGVKSITFEGTIGGQYHIWASADGKNWTEIAKNEAGGAAKYTLLDLTPIAEAVAGTAKLYIKIGDAVTSNGGGGQIKGEAVLTVVYDKNANQDPIIPDVITEHEKIVFRVETDAEKPYLFENTAKWNKQHRYGDKDAYYTYKYSVKNTVQVLNVIWKAKTCQEFKLDISFDNKNWETVSSSLENLAPQMREYNLTKFLVNEDGSMKADTFYLKICDADPADGWGGGIWGDADVTLDVEYTPLTDEQKDAIEGTATEHSIPLWGANKTWGDVWTTDNENQLAGSGCISINLNGVKDVHAPSKTFDAVDATGMDSVEFDIYLSDLAILDHLAACGGSLELTSSGTCDYQEKNYSITNLANWLKEHNAVVGWNHVTIAISQMAATNDGGDPNKADIAGAFDISKINYIRFFWTGMTDCGQDWIMKLDNFRMTDAQARADAAADAFKQQVLEENAGLIANIENLKTITAVNKDNYAAAKEKLTAATSAFNALTEEAQAILLNEGYKKPINDLKRLVEAYEEELAVLDANKALIDELNALAAYKDAASITAENIDAVKAAIAAAQTKVDSLDKDAKALLADYIANIAAAQASVDAYVPAPAKKGCGSALTMGAVATMILAGAWVTIAARKKED